MREIIIASCNGNHFTKKEKVIAFNVVFKDNKSRIVTYIEPYSDELALHDDEMCKSEHYRDYSIYNIGEYKVMGVLGDFAKIAQWERDD